VALGLLVALLAERLLRGGCTVTNVLLHPEQVLVEVDCGWR